MLWLRSVRSVRRALCDFLFQACLEVLIGTRLGMDPDSMTRLLRYNRTSLHFFLSLSICTVSSCPLDLACSLPLLTCILLAPPRLANDIKATIRLTSLRGSEGSGIHHSSHEHLYKSSRGESGTETGHVEPLMAHTSLIAHHSIRGEMFKAHPSRLNSRRSQASVKHLHQDHSHQHQSLVKRQHRHLFPITTL